MSRQRKRVGRDVAYHPSAAEATTGGGPGPFAAKITMVNADGTVNLFVFEPDGTAIAKTDVTEGETAGQFSFYALPGS